jgi:hypothetical protein
MELELLTSLNFFEMQMRRRRRRTGMKKQMLG